MTKIKDLIKELEFIAPPSLQEGYDNSGLIVGNQEASVTGVIFCLDSTEDVIQEAIDKDCNLVIAHHPIVFSGLKRFTGSDYVQRSIIHAIKNDIAIYVILYYEGSRAPCIVLSLYEMESINVCE